MSYKIVVQDAAKKDAREYAAYIRSESQYPVPAARWLDDLESLIQSLDDMPNRFRAIDEQGALEIPLRQVMHYSHRVV